MAQNWQKTLCFLLMLYCVGSTASKNSNLTCAETSDSVIFTCKCIRDKDVDAVQWFNGSTDIPLTIDANSCRAVSLEKSPFVPSSINNFTCDTSTNIYTLTLTIRLPVSCTCLDPDAQEPDLVTRCQEAVSTTTPTGNSGDVVRDGGGSSLWYIGLILAVVLVIVISIGIWCRSKRKTGKCKISDPEKKHSPVPEYRYQVLNKNACQDSSSQDGKHNYKDINPGSGHRTGRTGLPGAVQGGKKQGKSVQ